MSAETDTIRIIIADLGTGPDQLFSDEQLLSFLALNDDNIRLSAADALEAIAASEVLVSKKIRTQTLTTDGPAVSAELRALAQRQRDLAQKDEDAADEGLFDIVDTLPSLCRPELTEHEVWGL